MYNTSRRVLQIFVNCHELNLTHVYLGYLHVHVLRSTWRCIVELGHQQCISYSHLCRGSSKSSWCCPQLYNWMIAKTISMHRNGTLPWPFSPDAIVLYDTFGNIGNIADASLDQLTQCCIPKAVAEAVHEFFRDDCVPQWRIVQWNDLSLCIGHKYRMLRLAIIPVQWEHATIFSLTEHLKCACRS